LAKCMLLCSRRCQGFRYRGTNEKRRLHSPLSGPLSGSVHKYKRLSRRRKQVIAGSRLMGSLEPLGRRNASQSVASLFRASWYTQVTTSAQHIVIKYLLLLHKLSSIPLEQVASAKHVRLCTKPFPSPRPALSAVLSVCRPSWSLADSTRRCLHHLGKDRVNHYEM
jgi:hypothetical protein